MGGHDNHLDRPESAQAGNQPPTPARFQFSLRSVFVLVTAVAIVCAVYRIAGESGASVMFVALAAAFYAYLGWDSRLHRHATAAALGCFLVLGIISLLIPTFDPPISHPSVAGSSSIDPRLRRGAGMTVGLLMGLFVAVPYVVGLWLCFLRDDRLPTNRRTLAHSFWIGPVAFGLMIATTFAASHLLRYASLKIQYFPLLVSFVPPFLVGRHFAAWLFGTSKPSNKNSNASGGVPLTSSSRKGDGADE